MLHGSIWALWVAVGGMVILGVAALAAVLYAAVSRWNEETSATPARFAEKNRVWNDGEIQGRVRAIFAALERGRATPDFCLPRELASDHFLWKHRLAGSGAGGGRLPPRRFGEARVVQALRSEESGRDEVWVCVKSMKADRPVAEDAIRVLLSGYRAEDARVFQDLWKLVHRPEGWVVDEINENAGTAGAADDGPAAPALPSKRETKVHCYRKQPYP